MGVERAEGAWGVFNKLFQGILFFTGKMLQFLSIRYWNVGCKPIRVLRII